jgi:ubiquinone/menaquinone biosynthesis C-methylase UbiE
MGTSKPDLEGTYEETGNVHGSVSPSTAKVHEIFRASPRVLADRYDVASASLFPFRMSRPSVLWRRSGLPIERSAEERTMNPNKALWEKGDFTRIAVAMRESGEAFARSLRVTPGMRVLDLGCGDGTTALPLAQLGADVTGIDIASNLVEAGNRRAAEAGLSNLRFREGDACDLEGVADASFDLTLSVFGAMFAPRPFDVAREMVRVTRPGGRVVMGNWIPGDPTFVAQVLKISSAFTPPPPEGFISPMTWGTEANILERFGQAGIPPERIEMTKDTFTMRAPDRSPAEVMALFRQFYGPTMNAFEAAEKSGRAAELHEQLVQLAEAQNTAEDGGTALPATFMRVTVSV